MNKKTILIFILFLVGCGGSKSEIDKPYNDASIVSQLASVGLPIGSSTRMAQDRYFNLIQPITAKKNLGVEPASVCAEVSEKATNESVRQENAGLHNSYRYFDSSYYLTDDDMPIGYPFFRIPIAVPSVDYYIVYTDDGECSDWFVLLSEG